MSLMNVECLYQIFGKNNVLYLLHIETTHDLLKQNFMLLNNVLYNS